MQLFIRAYKSHVATSQCYHNQELLSDQSAYSPYMKVQQYNAKIENSQNFHKVEVNYKQTCNILLKNSSLQFEIYRASYNVCQRAYLLWYILTIVPSDWKECKPSSYSIFLLDFHSVYGHKAESITLKQNQLSLRIMTEQKPHFLDFKMP